MSFLFHYTNISALESILKHRTIRFSSLSFVNDKFEGETQDIGNLGKYIFISCWTTNEKENSRLWSLYGDHSHGVRIALEYPVFKLFFDEANSPSLVPHIPEERENYVLLPTETDKLIVEVEYSDDMNDIKPTTLYEFWDQGLFNFGKVGKWKSNAWVEEEESRFIIYSLPICWNNDPDLDARIQIGNAIQQMKMDKEMPIQYLDLKIQDEIFKNMRIMKGPKITNLEERNLMRIINQYNPTANIQDSSQNNVNYI